MESQQKPPVTTGTVFTPWTGRRPNPTLSALMVGHNRHCCPHVWTSGLVVVVVGELAEGRQGSTLGNLGGDGWLVITGKWRGLCTVF